MTCGNSVCPARSRKLSGCRCCHLFAHQHLKTWFNRETVRKGLSPFFVSSFFPTFDCWRLLSFAPPSPSAPHLSTPIKQPGGFLLWCCQEVETTHENPHVGPPVNPHKNPNQSSFSKKKKKALLCKRRTCSYPLGRCVVSLVMTSELDSGWRSLLFLWSGQSQEKQI